MLAAISLLKDRRDRLEIGFKKSDPDENARAEGNILGSYGGEPNEKRARDFLGISEVELRKIIQEVVGDG
jgi:hypothetical protein